MEGWCWSRALDHVSSRGNTVLEGSGALADFDGDSHPRRSFLNVSTVVAMSNVELGVQTEKAFQKQPLFLNSKVARKSTRAKRWYKDVGLGFKTPSAAVSGTYIGM